MNDSNTTSVDALRPPAGACAISMVPAELHGLSERAHPLARRDSYTLLPPAQRKAFSDVELVDALAQAVLDCGATLTASCDYRL